MGMSTHVVGFRPPNTKWKQMKQIWDSCSAAGIEPPREVSEFFNWCSPDVAGVEVELDGDCIEEYSGNCSSGVEVDVTKLPKDVTIVRFFNSY